MEKNDKENNNFRTLGGGSEKLNKTNTKNVPDNYADVLAGDNHHPVRSESSYDNNQIIDKLDSSTTSTNKGDKGSAK